MHTHVLTHTLRLTFCSLLNDHFSLKRKLYRLDTEMYNSILGVNVKSLVAYIHI